MTTGNEQGQQKEETPLEREARDWVAKQKIAEAKKGITQSEIDKLKAQLPSGETKAAEGKITTNEKSGYVAELATYNTMRHLAKDIAKIVLDKGKQNIKGILLTTTLDYSYTNVQSAHMSLQVESFKHLVKRQITKIESLIKPRARETILAGAQLADGRMFMAPLLAGAAVPLATKAAPFLAGAAVEGISGTISALADVIGYFRMDYEVKGKTISVSDTAFRAMVANHIPPPVYLSEFHNIDIEKSYLLKTLGLAIAKRNELQLLIGQLNKTISASGTGEPGKKKPSPAELLCEESMTLVKEFDSFVKTITTVSEGKTYSPLANALIREHVSTYMKEKRISHLLYLTITSAGGEQVTRSGPFNLCARIWYLGGCVATYFLADLDGKIVASDTISGSAHVLYKLGGNRLSDFTFAAH